jgi:hypothetical protein
MEEALTVWEMLDFSKKWQYWGKWTEFLKVSNVAHHLAVPSRLTLGSFSFCFLKQSHTSAKSISKDTWRQFFDFYKAHPTGFDAYDEDSAATLFFIFCCETYSLVRSLVRLVAHLVR